MARFTAKGKITMNKRKSMRSKRRAPKSKKNFVKAVQSVINKNLEDKMAYKSVVDVNYNSGINSQTDLNSIVPNISNGTNDHARVGDQVHCKSLVVQGHILSNLTYTNYASCRIGVRMMVVSPKGYAGYDPAYNSATTWLAYLLKKGGAVSGFSGAVSDFYAPINRDAITVHYDRKFYVKAPYVPGTSSGDLSTSGSTKFFKIKIPIRNKLLKYDPNVNSGLTPTQFNPFLILGYCHLDNSTPDTVDAQLNLSFTSIMVYQDA